MFKKERTLLLAACASAETNNLAVWLDGRRSEAVAVIHGDRVSLTPASGTELKARLLTCLGDNSPTVVTQVHYCWLGNEWLLAVTSSLGLQIYDCHVQELRYSHPCSDSSSDNLHHYAKGITNPQPHYLCVGNNRGTIRLFTSCEDGTIMFIDRKQSHMAPISDMDSNSDIIASSDTDGNISIWNFNQDELIHLNTIDSYGSSITSIRLWKNLVVASYGSGHVRLFNLTQISDPYLAVEICAHARWITAMDVAPERGYILTVSEDSFARVFQIHRTENTTVSHKFSTQIKDCMLVGGRFLTPSGSSFAVSIYGNNLVQCFKM